MQLRSTLLALALIGTASIPAAQAGPLTATEILRQFNVVTIGNFATNSDVEGRTVVGGSLTGGATFFNKPGAAAGSEFRALTVYGSSTTGGPLNIDNGGGVTIAGTAAGMTNTNGGGGRSIGGGPNPPAPNPLPGFAETFVAPLSALSAELALMTANSTLPGAATPGFPNNVPITASAGSGLAVFNVTVAQLSAFASFSLNLNGREGAVFNVTGGSYGGQANFLNATSVARDVIWNFAEATSLDFQRQWGGTVLAPHAAVRNHTPIEGSLFAASYDGRGEMHSQPTRLDFDGNAPVPVPEPASLALFGLGLAGLGLVRRRQRAA
ncbi:collagen-binding domain-containing protein [Falsiroseomonas tokyonensis]|uniref:Collagen-binding domain-containing protein n=1 Tax=Falsiroseomonas tokyonensis TaxID=430521 RepID=A0ABV7C169_9PROT|nr:collagen-binding domain-containing protein [Falsiroseomonas tokyonensis]MBU8540395.1 choice-of-anchor A family protein [Falsiroseomonas tokyonensis]